MRLILVGYGRMGRAVEAQATARGHGIAGVFDVENPLAPDAPAPEADALVDFSVASAAPEVLRWAAQRSLPVVEGTTGWYEDVEKVKGLPGLTMVYSPNFSVGVYCFSQLVRLAGDLLGAVEGYDPYVHEWHHSGKADSPSGTALSLARILLQTFPLKRELQTGRCDRAIRPEELHVSSTRSGRFPGIHEIGFDSSTDRITLRHEAHGRDGFALGAVLAAEWIAGRTGIFTMDDLMQSLLGKVGD